MQAQRLGMYQVHGVTGNFHAYYELQTRCVPLSLPDDINKRWHYLCISSPAIPLPPGPVFPGPGHYDITTRPVEQRYMSSAVFLSNEPRWVIPGSQAGIGIEVPQAGPTLTGFRDFLLPFTTSTDDNETQPIGASATLPGPTHYNPSAPGRQSFHYNANNVWIA
ncbi:unnamed protein product [Protopolystoma xenopodis]|uniref:Uncharacterized protein n=1 Tax=Protopolystoma xenopodis TaxID=117903 RepID=A0A3S5CU87_9PLAT|nr:unnamed protein product [Protopolystoma xenopodis]